MPSGAVEANTTPPAASSTAARPAATSAYRPPASGWRTKFGWMASSAPMTVMVMAPSISAETRNSASETSSTAAGMRTPEISSSASARSALTATESAPPARAPAEVIRQVSRQDADDRHVDDVGAQRQDAAVLKHQRLDGQDRAHHHARRRRPQRAGQQRAAHQVSAGADADREVDHLGGEDKCSHHAQQRHSSVVKSALRHADDVAHGRRRRRVQRSPHRGGEESVWYMHGRLQSSTNGRFVPPEWGTPSDSATEWAKRVQSVVEAWRCQYCVRRRRFVMSVSG